MTRSGKPAWTSQIVLWWALTILWLVIAVAWWGWYGGLFFVIQSVLAIMYLDVINYLQHYGLTRRLAARRTPEPIQDHHSWTQGRFLDDLILFNLPRHANHHSQPQLPFQLLADSGGRAALPVQLRHHDDAVLVPAVVSPDRPSVPRSLRGDRRGGPATTQGW